MDNNNNNDSNQNKYNKVKLDFYNNIVSYEYPRVLESILTKDEYEQLISELNIIIKNPNVSRKYYLLPFVIILGITFLVFLFLFVDIIDKYTAIALGIIIGMGSTFSVVYYYLYKRSENITQQLKQFNNNNSKYGIKFIFSNDSTSKQLSANLYYLINNNSIKYNEGGSYNYNGISNEKSTIQLSTEDKYVVEMDSISNNNNNNNSNNNNNNNNNNSNNNNNNNNKKKKQKNEQKQSLLNNYNNDYDESSSSAVIINDYHQYNHDEEDDESLTI